MVDDQFEQLMISDPAAWERARRLARLTALVEPLHGLEISHFEHAVLEWLSAQDAGIVAVVVALLWRARQSTAVRTGVGTPPFDGAHPVRLALALDVVDLLERHGYQQPARRRSLADFLRKLNALVTAYEAGKC